MLLLHVALGEESGKKMEMRFLFMGFDLICCNVIVGRVELIIVAFIIY